MHRFVLYVLRQSPLRAFSRHPLHVPVQFQHLDGSCDYTYQLAEASLEHHYGSHPDVCHHTSGMHEMKQLTLPIQVLMNPRLGLRKKRGILQVLYIFSRKENRYAIFFRKIADVWPPKRTFS
nr:hypothetical protein Iba_chr07cCG12160 [Ipomoea batatas]